MLVTDEYQSILIIDDNPNIHQDFYKVLGESPPQETESAEYEELKSILLEIKPEKKIITAQFKIDSAYQGSEGLELVKKAIQKGRPYSLAFIDIRMPPGWDGVKTAQAILEIDPNIHIVLCTAYSDYSFSDIAKRLSATNRWLILKKPFDIIEISQMARALTEKWKIEELNRHRTENLEKLVSEKTALIKATLESIEGGVIATSVDGKILCYNNIFLLLWNLNNDFMDNVSFDNLIKILSEKVEESSYFLEILSDLAATPKSGIIKEWKCKNGKTLELFSHPQYLNNAISGCVFSFRDVTERKQLECELMHQASHDSLTNLPNRLVLIDRLQQSIMQAKRHQLQIGVLLLDLDNFKRVNDSLGHRAGDLLLQMVSAKLKKYFCESDTIARLGGDEFVVLLGSDHNESEIIAKAKNILAVFNEPFELEKHQLTVTTSIGIGIYPIHGSDPETLLKNADAALYHAKSLGRNTYQFYRSEFSKNILEREELTTALRQALAKHELVLYYQPLINLNTEAIVGVEALIRWNHPKLGLVPPDTFIPLAEETGLILAIGEWVLTNACKQIRVWQKQFSSKLKMAINISGYQFRQNDFAETVTRIIRETGADPHSLELEVTETLILENIPEVLKKMAALKEIGVHFSIDDFGIGYSSLNYIKYFPFDKVKIDKAFIAGLPVSANDQSIVTAIINMTESFNIEVVAEGVENNEQVDFLRHHHSEQVQGYYYSPPVNEEACVKMLSKQYLDKDKK